MSTRRAVVAATISAMVAAGGGAALAQPGGGTHAAKHAKHAKRAHGNRRGAAKPGAKFAKRAVHVEAVVPAKGGTFATKTFDRGAVTGVSGNQLTIKEGTKKATYKTITLTIPAGAKVVVNGAKATLSDVKPGQVAIVVQAPKHTRVVAHDAHAPTTTP